jgi:hypothetical protein
MSTLPIVRKTTTIKEFEGATVVEYGKRMLFGISKQAYGDALCDAAFEGNLAIVDHLLKNKKQDVNYCDPYGFTAMDSALTSPIPCYAIFKRLLDAGASTVNMHTYDTYNWEKEESGSTALEVTLKRAWPECGWKQTKALEEAALDPWGRISKLFIDYEVPFNPQRVELNHRTLYRILYDELLAEKMDALLECMNVHRVAHLILSYIC